MRYNTNHFSRSKKRGLKQNILCQIAKTIKNQNMTIQVCLSYFLHQDSIRFFKWVNYKSFAFHFVF